MKRFTLSLLILFSASLQSFGQNFHVVKDINSEASSFPGNDFYDSLGAPRSAYAILNNVAYFFADDGEHGKELWRSDGTNSGTYMLKDINPGRVTSIPSSLVLFKGALYFAANDGVNGTELWKTDGTTEGTIMVKDIYPGKRSSMPSSLISTSRGLFFRAGDKTHGLEIWKSDGTASGTTIIADLNPGANGSNPSPLCSVNGWICFFAYSNSMHLWRTDGTSNGTDSLVAINMNNSSIVSTGKKMFFPDNAGNLWVTDGTKIGTAVVKNFPSSIYLYDMVAFGNNVYFGAPDQNNGESLWTSNGTTAGTVPVKDVTPGVDSERSIINKTVVGNTLFFMGANAMGNYDLWKTDGTTGGTALVKKFDSGYTPPAKLFNVNNSLYLSVYNESQGYEFWKSDGTSSGTFLIKEINPGVNSSEIHYLTQLNGFILFSADNKSTGVELWKSDGTSAGTLLVKDINVRNTGDADPNSLTAFGGKLYFKAIDNPYGGYELWTTDGTRSGTNLIKNMQPHNYGGVWQGYFPFGVASDNMLFTSSSFENGLEIWKSDGTRRTTVMVRDLTPGRAGSTINFPLTPTGASINSNFIFTVRNYTGYKNGSGSYSGETLWKTDGSTNGTQALKITAGTFPSVIKAGNNVYFTEANGTIHLWKTDGNSVTQISNATPAEFTYLFADSNYVYFQSASNTLWRSDGTTNGTYQLSTIYPNPYFYNDYHYKSNAVLNNHLIFSARDANGSRGNELYITDGTAIGTTLLADINPGTAGSDPYNFVVVGNTLFFVANDGIHGTELWRTDGTTAGTKLVKDIIPGSSSASILSPVGVGNKLCFLVTDNVNHKNRLWESNGSEGGTFEITDVTLSKISFLNLSRMESIEDLLYFIGKTKKSGIELWVGTIEQSAQSGSSSNAALTNLLNKVAVSPNPLGNNLRVSIASSSEQLVNITVVDLLGKTIVNDKRELIKGENFIAYNTSSWARGTYIVKVEFADNTFNTIKVVK